MIGIYGDSYTTEDRNSPFIHNHWPTILENMSGQNVVTYGHTGTSAWWSYQKFLATYKNYDTIVFGYSDYSRWQTLREPYHYMSNIIDETHIHLFSENSDVVRLLGKAHPILYNDAFNKFIYQNIFDSVNQICKDNGKKIINILIFDKFPKDMPISLDKREGTCIVGLTEISAVELENDVELMRFNRSNHDPRPCHMFPHNNQALAKIINEKIANGVDRKEIISAIKHPYFNINALYNWKETL